MYTILFVTIIGTFIATLGVTIMGLLSISTGKTVDNDKSNLLMRARVILQATTVGLLTLTTMEAV
jgi:hypothetical protein